MSFPGLFDLLLPEDAPGPSAPTVPLMSRDEATNCLWAIRTTTGSLRALVYDLYHRQGWRALGYETFRACVQHELSDVSESQVYRQVQAGVIEQQVLPHTRIGTVPEGILRPLAKVPPLYRKSVFDRARDKANAPLPTAEEIMDAADDVLKGSPVDEPAPSLSSRVQSETAAARDMVQGQDKARSVLRVIARLRRALKHMGIALKSLRACNKPTHATALEGVITALALDLEKP